MEQQQEHKARYSVGEKLYVIIRKLFSCKCCECKEVKVWFWKRRCSFCDEGEGLMKN